MSSISDTLLEHGSNESDGLCLVEGETPSESLLSEGACLERVDVHVHDARSEERTW